MSQTSMPETPRCRAHGQPSWVLCQRCGNAVCPDCQVRAAVGVHCTACAKSNQPAFAQKIARVRGPLVTYILMGICGILFLADLASPEVFRQLAFSPAAGEGQFYRFLTTTFLHAGWMHLAFNMYALYLLGKSLEPLLGRAQFLALYLLGALGGSVAVLWLSSPTSMAWVTGTVGASGAIFALFGGIFAIQRAINADTTQILVLLLINGFISFTVPNISWQGHLGGLIVGVVLGSILIRTRRPDRVKSKEAFRQGKRGLSLWLAGNARTWGAIAGVFVVLVASVLARYATVTQTVLG
ncbi:MAG: rhomboid family intramembrane serine protease [Buchananella hordeovulneris]|nr:rhomboid family intramembrane serine protease [Buchananella hordeovulneris]